MYSLLAKLNLTLPTDGSFTLVLYSQADHSSKFYTWSATFCKYDQ